MPLHHRACQLIVLAALCQLIQKSAEVQPVTIAVTHADDAQPARREQVMSWRTAFAFAACSAALMGQTKAAPDIDFPGSTRTDAWGINNAGEIVGTFVQGGRTHGFLLRGGQYTQIDFPEATSTTASKINNRGDIVGGVSEAGDPQLGIPSEYGAPPIWPVTRLNHAVLWKDGQCIDLQDLVPADSPWNLHTAVAINARGQIVTWAAKLNDPPDPDDPYKDYIIHLILLDPTQ